MILIEQLALSNFKSYLTDTSWQVKNCCRWHGIRCSNTLHVVAADVRNPLVLWFHSHILVLIWAWNIKDSHTISVRSTHTKNALEGNIPREIGLLRGLFMLKHSWNGLHGEIPNIIGNMSGLESLDLSFNCWWEKPLLVALKHSEGIKHKVLLQKHKLTINEHKSLIQYTPSLFLSNVSLYSLHTE